MQETIPFWAPKTAQTIVIMRKISVRFQRTQNKLYGLSGEMVCFKLAVYTK